MSEEPNNNQENKTDINDLVEEVERLLKEVEEKEEIEKVNSRDIAGEMKEIFEKPDSKTEKKKKEIIKEETKVKIRKEEKTETPKRGRGRPKKVTIVEELEVEEPVQEVKVEIKQEIEEVEQIVETKVEKEAKSSELITIKGETKELTVTKEQLEKIENEIKKQKDIPKSDRELINKKIFKNIIIAVFIVTFFLSINLGFLKLKEETLLNDLRVFSGILIIVTIVFFEKAYKKESKDLTIMGIETLFLSIITLLANYIYFEFYGKFLYIVNAISMLFAIYYVGKAIISYIKMRKAAFKRISDIRNIINRSK